MKEIFNFDFLGVFLFILSNFYLFVSDGSFECIYLKLFEKDNSNLE